MADFFENLSVDDMNTLSTARDIQRTQGPVAGREVSRALVQQQTANLPQFFQGLRQETSAKAKMAEARKQTDFMKQALQSDRNNFDAALKNKRVLSSIDQAATSQLVDAEIQFKRDSLGRKLLSERQLMDWLTTKAKSDQDWAGFQQRQKQLHDRKSMILDAAYAKIRQAEKMAYQRSSFEISKEADEFIARAKADLEEKKAKAKRDAANKAALASALGTVGSIAGGIIGAYGGPAGAAAGAAIGGMAGTYIGTQIG